MDVAAYCAQMGTPVYSAQMSLFKETVPDENIFLLYVFMQLCLEQLLYRINFWVLFVLDFFLPGEYLYA